MRFSLSFIPPRLSRPLTDVSEYILHSFFEFLTLYGNGREREDNEKQGEKHEKDSEEKKGVVGVCTEKMGKLESCTRPLTRILTVQS